MTRADGEERRQSTRLRIVDKLEGKIVKTDDLGDVIRLRTVNVSAYGMGVHSNRFLDPGHTVVMRVGSRQVSMVVRWCSSNEEDGIYRLGLESQAKDLDLVDLFVRYGFRVDRNILWAGPRLAAAAMFFQPISA